MLTELRSSLEYIYIPIIWIAIMNAKPVLEIHNEFFFVLNKPAYIVSFFKGHLFPAPYGRKNKEKINRSISSVLISSANYCLTLFQFQALYFVGIQNSIQSNILNSNNR